MRWKLFIEFCLTVFIVSILAGDLFLPQPYRSGTQQLRSSLNNYFTGLLPRRTNLKSNFTLNVPDFSTEKATKLHANVRQKRLLVKIRRSLLAQ
jgi:hypothetical protein